MLILESAAYASQQPFSCMIVKLRWLYDIESESM